MSKLNSERKSITLQKKNIKGLEKLVEAKRYKNFSQAVDAAIEDKLQGVFLDNCDLEQIPEDISFLNVAKKVVKGAKNGY